MRRRDKRDEYKRDPDLLKGVDKIDYKDAELLKKFMTDRGKILSRKLLGTTEQQQRQIKQAVRRARVVGLIR